MYWPNFTPSKLCIASKNSVKSFCTHVLWGTYPYPVSVSDFTDFFKNSHNSIKLCWNKLKKMQRLSNDELNQAIGMLYAGMSATIVSRHFGCTQKTIEHLRRRFHVTGNVLGHCCWWWLYHLATPIWQTSDCSSSWKTVWYSSTDCQKLVETKR